MIDAQFFLTIYGEKLNDHTVQKTYERLRKVAKVVRTDGSRYQPRLNDLRHTFAVHRLTAWYQRGADLNRMLPALAAYMGMSDLRATGRYRALTPERFRKQLKTLSPMQAKTHWRDDIELMKFLDSL
jgi:integrase/recombinase XerD